MRIPRWVFCLLGVGCCSLAGCSQSGWLRPRDPAEMKTVASIEGKPVSSSAGEPGTGLARRRDFDDAGPPTAAGARVSGRVFDEDGRAVPNAKVRLVVGGAPGGRANFATTDRSGAFTLHGLRPGRDYTLIAEYQAEDGMMSGRVRTRAPETGLRIALGARDQEIEAKTSHLLPSRKHSGLFADEAAEDFPVAARPRVRDDAEAIDRDPVGDREPPAEEALAAAPRSRRSVGDARLASATPGAPATVRAGWTVRHDPSEGPARRDRNGPPMPDVADDEGENPLPPALEPEGSDRPRASGRDEVLVPSESRKSRARRTPTRPAADDRISAADRDEAPAPRPIPADAFPSADGGRSGDEPAAPISRRRAAPRRAPHEAPPASSRTRRPSRPDSEDAGAVDDDAPRARSTRRPTWRELSIRPGDVPVDESLRRSSYEEADDVGLRDEGVVRAVGRAPEDVPADAEDGDRPDPTPGVVRAGTTATIEPARPRRKRPPGSPVPARRPAPAVVPIGDGVAVCRLDAGRRRVVELRLPGLDGAPISLADFDADLILIDFWGSWCRECRPSIEHHRGLQEQVSSGRLQVIGIACEKGPTFEARRDAAAAAARRLGINYPVLVTNMGGDCPVQKAFQVQFYPSMILLDRQGNILQFQQGSLDANLDRLDRAIARALRDDDRRADDEREGQASLRAAVGSGTIRR